MYLLASLNREKMFSINYKQNLGSKSEFDNIMFDIAILILRRYSTL